MPKSQDSVGRRGFLKTAATSAAGIVAGAKPGYGQAHQDHDHQAFPPTSTLRVKALESLLVEKGLVDPAALDASSTLTRQVGPRNGARVVARAWVDPAYKKRLLADARRRSPNSATSAAGRAHGRGREHAEGAQPGRLHAVLLLSLAGARSAAGVVQIGALSFARGDRSARRAAEFGARPAEDVEVRVWDSTAEMRYLVLPERPAGSEADEEALAALVTRDAMVGVAKSQPQRRGQA